MMEDNAKERLMSLLFESNMKLLNIKFFPGTPGPVPEEAIWAEVLSALEQRRSGALAVSGDFLDKAERVDVRVLVATL